MEGRLRESRANTGKCRNTTESSGSLWGMQETFGQRLARLLREKHYGKAETAIARQSGVDLKTLRKAVADEGKFRHGTVMKLADYCGVSYEYLLTGEGQQEPPPADLDEIRSRVDEAMQLLQEIARDLDAQAGNGKP